MSVEAEMSVLGGAILDRECAFLAADALAPEMFTHGATRRIFQKITDLHGAGKPVDGVLLINELPEDRVAIVKLAEYVPSLNHFGEYLKIVRDEWQMRTLGESLSRIAAESGTVEDAVDSVRELAEEHGKLLAAKGDQTITSFGEAARELKEWLRSKERRETIACGYSALDKATGGFLRSTVFALAARPGGGKTDFAVNLALRMGKRGARVLYFTMEMTNKQLMQRVVSSLLQMDGTRVRDKDLTERELQSVDAVLDNFEQAGKISFVQEPRISVQRVRHFADLWKPDVIFIDHLGLMERPNLKDPFKALGMVSNQLKQLALEKEIALVELVQMNRQIEARASKKPALTDLRESGDIEQDCDYVGFLIPEDLKDKSLTGTDSASAALYLEKNRHGRPGIFSYRWQPQYHRFMEVENHDGAMERSCCAHGPDRFRV